MTGHDAVKALLLILLVLALAWAFVLWRASVREAQAEADYPPEGHIIEVNGHRVHAVVMGHGPDVVLIHGASGSTRDMTFRLAPALAQRYRVIALDRPGLGYTDRLSSDGSNLFEQAALLSAAARQLGAENPILVGHSYGGAVALAWAVEYPGHAAAIVTLGGASHPWDTPLDPLYRVTSNPLGSALVVPLITAFVPAGRVESGVNGVFRPQSAPDGYIAHFGPGITLRRASLRENALQRASILDDIRTLSLRYGDISVPVEILHGTEDDIVSLTLHAEQAARDIPDAALTRLDGIGHMPQHVSQPQVEAAIDRAAARAGLR